jgi:hypothetical protein
MKCKGRTWSGGSGTFSAQQSYAGKGVTHENYSCLLQFTVFCIRDYIRCFCFAGCSTAAGTKLSALGSNAKGIKRPSRTRADNSSYCWNPNPSASIADQPVSPASRRPELPVSLNEESLLQRRCRRCKSVSGEAFPASEFSLLL